jgi:TPR repeat protein
MTRVAQRLQYAADHGHVKAAEELSIVYSRTAASPHAREKQLYWAKRAAELGSPEQAHQYATFLMSPHQNPDIAAAIEWFTRAAKAGYRRSMWELGIMYNDGNRIAQDNDRANYWFRRLADVGSTDGMVLLAMNVQAGYGASGDPAEAVKLYRTAYRAGDTGRAPYLLGLSYEFGRAVPKNTREAIKWYERVRGTVDVCTALFRAGRLYENGDGVERDVSRALAYYERAQRADPYQCWSLYEHLAELHDEGRNVRKDPVKAQELRRKAATAKSSYAGPGAGPRRDRYVPLLALDRP